MISKTISALIFIAASTNAAAYYTGQGKLFSEDDEAVNINGVSWSGFQDTNVFQGLQSNPFYAMTATSANKRDYGMMDVLIGAESVPGDFPLFKTVRIPIQPGVLYDTAGKVDLNASFADKSNPTEGNGLFCKTWATTWDGCQTSVSPKDAFWTVLSEMQKKNMRVLVDMHHRYGYGDGMRDGTVYDMTQYGKDIALLAEQIKTNELDNVVGIDVFNEPHQLSWFQNSNGQVPWTKVIATAANAIFDADPELVLFVEGADQGSNDPDTPAICVNSADITDDPNAYSHGADAQACGTLDRVYFKGNWGEDFKPLLEAASAKQGVAKFDRAQFERELTKQGIDADTLDWLLGDEFGNHGHLVFSPHVYPAEVAGWESAPGAPSNLRFDWTWGFLAKANYPVILGEASWKTDSGKAFVTDALMPYLKTNMQTSNLFFWGIGFLGDTVTAIDPQNGNMNSDVWNTMKPYFVGE
ncbi:MAG: glycoside hydrolase family 5 protein [Gammaproteobacteria bacterium]|nr:glycoside hydrolase family 5 protein [Gammaproteobacteria bacterium]